jgi:radical SAM superfamily enzyme YgiQ (UPF0313 family)
MFLLVNSPNYSYQDDEEKISQVYSPPLGLGYLATYLIDSGISTQIIDAEALQLSVSQIVNTINTTPDITGVGLNIFTPNLSVVKEIVDQISEDITIVLGGAHITASGPEIMNHEWIRRCILIQGEAEFKLKSLLEGEDLENIPGLMYFDGIQARYQKDSSLDPHWIPHDLDQLRLDHDLLTPPLGSNSVGRAVILTSRGCPYSCSFCAGARGEGKPPVRLRSIENIIEEITWLFENRGVTDIKPLDDLFLLNEKRTIKFFTALEQLPYADELSFRVHGRVNVLDKFSESTLELMGKYIKKIMIGVESGSERILSILNKGITPEQTRSVVERLAKHRISVSGYFMIGIPTESREELDETIRLARDLIKIAHENGGEFHPVTYVYRPYPGTELWKRYIESGLSYDEIMEFKEISLSDETSSIEGRGMRDHVPTHWLHSIDENYLYQVLLEMRMLGYQVRTVEGQKHFSKEK